MGDLNRVFELYKQILDAHIKTKTVCTTFHQKSEWFYDLAFEVFHSISEKMQDIQVEAPGDEEELKRRAYNNIEEIKNIVWAMIASKQSYWMDNLLRWLYDKLEFACWDARAFVKDDYEEESQESEDNKEEKIKIKLLKVKR